MPKHAHDHICLLLQPYEHKCSAIIYKINKSKISIDQNSQNDTKDQPIHSTHEFKCVHAQYVVATECNTVNQTFKYIHRQSHRAVAICLNEKSICHKIDLQSARSQYDLLLRYNAEATAHSDSARTGVPARTSFFTNFSSFSFSFYLTQ